MQFERDPRTQESLADTLLAAAARDPGALPLLEFTLDELYKRAAAENRQTLTRADYDALGGLEGALATRAEAVFADIQARDARAADALPEVFGALARLAPADECHGGDAAAVVSQTAPLEAFRPGGGGFGGRDDRRAAARQRPGPSARGARGAAPALGPGAGLDRREPGFSARARPGGRGGARAGGRRASAEDFLLPRGKPLAEGEDLLARRRAELTPEEIAFVEASTEARRRGRSAPKPAGVGGC